MSLIYWPSRQEESDDANTEHFSSKWGMAYRLTPQDLQTLLKHIVKGQEIFLGPS